MNRLATACLAVLIALPATAATAATAAAQSDIHLRVTPRVGLLTPADWFYDEFSHFGMDPLEWTEAAILRASLVGLTAEIEIGDSGLWIRGEVLRTIGGDTYLAHAVLNESIGFDPPSVDRTRFWIPSTLTFGALDLALPTKFQLPGGIQPYVIVGVGGKRYDFDISELQYQFTVVAPADGVEWMANLGGGVTVDVFGFHLDFLVKDALSEYWGDLQHDMVWLAGLTWPLF